MIDDVRDIEIKFLNVYAPCSEPLRPFAGKYWLKNYRGPISFITCQCDGNYFRIEIGLEVLDAHTKKPVKLKAATTSSQYALESYHDNRKYFERALRNAILSLTTHELDECFMRDGKFVTDPHPEIFGYAGEPA